MNEDKLWRITQIANQDERDIMLHHPSLISTLLVRKQFATALISNTANSEHTEKYLEENIDMCDLTLKQYLRVI